MNTLLQSQDMTRRVYELLETNAREAQLCVQLLVANIGKPDPFLVMDRFSSAYRTACRTNESLSQEICTTFFAHLQNKDIARLSKSLDQITHSVRAFSRKSIVLISQIDTAELAAQTNLLLQISDITTDMIVALCRHSELQPMIIRRHNLKQLEEEVDAQTQYRIGHAMENGSDPMKTIATLSLCNSLGELIDVCIHAGYSAFEIHLRYA